MKDISSSDQSRERRHTHRARDAGQVSSLLFSRSHLTEIAAGRAGIVVDALRLDDAGLTFGRVVSGGHEVVLEDPENVTVLIPTQGHIAIESARKDYGLSVGSLALVEAEKRRTRVVAPKSGVFVATILLIPRSRLRGGSEGAAVSGRRSLASRIDTPLGIQLRQLLPDLASDLFNQSDRLLSPRALDELVGLIDDLMAEAGGQHRFTNRPLGGISEFRRVSQACDIIQGRYDEALSLTRLAAELQITPRCLQLSFESVLGMAPRDYLQKVRLERVRAQLLSQGDAGSVTRAAMDCGFLHLGRFSQMYRRAFGELPSETQGRRDRPRYPT